MDINEMLLFERLYDKLERPPVPPPARSGSVLWAAVAGAGVAKAAYELFGATGFPWAWFIVFVALAPVFTGFVSQVLEYKQKRSDYEAEFAFRKELLGELKSRDN